MQLLLRLSTRPQALQALRARLPELSGPLRALLAGPPAGGGDASGGGGGNGEEEEDEWKRAQAAAFGLKRWLKLGDGGSRPSSASPATTPRAAQRPSPVSGFLSPSASGALSIPGSPRGAAPGGGLVRGAFSGPAGRPPHSDRPPQLGEVAVGVRSLGGHAEDGGPCSPAATSSSSSSPRELASKALSPTSQPSRLSADRAPALGAALSRLGGGPGGRRDSVLSVASGSSVSAVGGSGSGVRSTESLLARDDGAGRAASHQHAPIALAPRAPIAEAGAASSWQPMRLGAGGESAQVPEDGRSEATGEDWAGDGMSDLSLEETEQHMQALT